jgi:hypothetical protein
MIGANFGEDSGGFISSSETTNNLIECFRAAESISCPPWAGAPHARPAADQAEKRLHQERIEPYSVYSHPL